MSAVNGGAENCVCIDSLLRTCERSRQLTSHVLSTFPRPAGLARELVIAAEEEGGVQESRNESKKMLACLGRWRFDKHVGLGSPLWAQVNLVNVVSWAKVRSAGGGPSATCCCCCAALILGLFSRPAEVPRGVWSHACLHQLSLEFAVSVDLLGRMIAPLLKSLLRQLVPCSWLWATPVWGSLCTHSATRLEAFVLLAGNST